MIDAHAFDTFHFLRPLWLLLVPLFPLIAWGVRRVTQQRREDAVFVAPHLAKALTVGGEARRGLQPVDGVVLVGVLATLAVAGPTWTRVVDPFAPEAPPMVIVLEVSETMSAIDVQPSRLERAKLKIHDLLELRAGAPTALVAYAGSAHRILPLTEDPAILYRFVEGLAPAVMPRPGRDASSALSVARETLTADGRPGLILFVNDGFDAADLAAFRDNRGAEGPPTMALVLGTDAGGALRDAAGGFLTDEGGRRRVDAVDASALARFASEGGVRIVRASIDRSDLRRVEREGTASVRSATQREGDMGWDDRGWALLWPAALFGAFWFRRGWTMRWSGSASMALCLCAFLPHGAEAGELADLFFTPDQQGRWAYEHLHFSEAGDLFEDAEWKGRALYEAGRYLEAADTYGRVLGADALFSMGNALVKGREYARGIKAYELALAEDPDHGAAARNLEITQWILEKLTKQRADEDRGDGSEGADEVRFDSDAEGGTPVEVSREEAMSQASAETWMRTVDPGIAEFLRVRFELELAAEEAP